MKAIQTILKRGTALAMASAMVCGCALGTAADSAVTMKKDETVYATLASDGSLKSESDSVWLHSDSGLAGCRMETGLSDLALLKDTDGAEISGSTVALTGGNDAYYQGKTDAELPLGVAITYTLDGTEMTAEELAGKSGHLVMHIAFTNKTAEVQEINGVKRSICTPFVAVSTMTLDTDTFQNIQAENGTTQTDSAKQLVAFICLPGIKQAYSGLLNGDLSELGDYLHDDATLEADVTDFEMPMLYIAAATDAKSLEKEDNLSDYSDLFDSLDGLDEKITKLEDGVQKLLDGSNTLNSGAGDLYNGIKTLDDGVTTLQPGAHAAADGAAKAASGAATLSGGLNALSGKSQSLRDGAYSVFTQLCTSAQDQINPALTQAGFSAITLTPESYAATLQTLIDSLGSIGYQTALQQVTAGVDGQIDSIYAQYISNNADAIYAGAVKDGVMAQLRTAHSEMDDDEFAAWVAGEGAETVQGAIAAAVQSLTKEQKAAILATAKENLTTDQKTAIRQGAIDQKMASQEVQDQINAGQTQADAQAAMLAAAKGKLSTYETFYAGLCTYTAGVDSAAGGAAELSSGLNTLKDGTAQISAGSDELKTGADKLLAGAATLKDGTNTLLAGVQELSDGVDEMTAKLDSGDFSVADLQALKDVTDAEKAARESYTSFAGDAAGSGSVKFVMKVTAEKADTTITTAGTAEADTQSGWGAFWARIKALFVKA